VESVSSVQGNTRTKQGEVKKWRFVSMGLFDRSARRCHTPSLLLLPLVVAQSCCLYPSLMLGLLFTLLLLLLSLIMLLAWKWSLSIFRTEQKLLGWKMNNRQSYIISGESGDTIR
jgi:hypothetical protein